MRAGAVSACRQLRLRFSRHDARRHYFDIIIAITVLLI